MESREVCLETEDDVEGFFQRTVPVAKMWFCFAVRGVEELAKQEQPLPASWSKPERRSHFRAFRRADLVMRESTPCTRKGGTELPIIS